MRFFLLPLMLLVIIATSAFAAPTEKALSKRHLDFSFRSGTALNDRIGVNGAKTPVGERRSSKQLAGFSFELLKISNARIVITTGKRGNEAEEELLHHEEYNLVVASSPSGTGLSSRGGIIDQPPPGNAVSGRSMGAYEGRHVMVSMPNDMVHNFQVSGGSEDQIPRLIGEAVRVMDPETGLQYQLVPDDSSIPTDTPSDHINLNLVYKFTSA